jgi:hypothetical protein
VVVQGSIAEIVAGSSLESRFLEITSRLGVAA